MKTIEERLQDGIDLAHTPRQYEQLCADAKRSLVEWRVFAAERTCAVIVTDNGQALACSASVAAAYGTVREERDRLQAKATEKDDSLSKAHADFLKLLDDYNRLREFCSHAGLLKAQEEHNRAVEELRYEVRKWADRFHGLWVNVEAHGKKAWPEGVWEIHAAWAREVDAMYEEKRDEQRS